MMIKLLFGGTLVYAYRARAPLYVVYMDICTVVYVLYVQLAFAWRLAGAFHASVVCQQLIAFKWIAFPN